MSSQTNNRRTTWSLNDGINLLQHDYKYGKENEKRPEHMHACKMEMAHHGSDLGLVAAVFERGN